jgi:hypothetical protein
LIEPITVGPEDSDLILEEPFQPVGLEQPIPSAGQNLVSDKATYRRRERNTGVHNRDIKSGNTSGATDRRKPILWDRTPSNDVRFRQEAGI